MRTRVRSQLRVRNGLSPAWWTLQFIYSTEEWQLIIPNFHVINNLRAQACNVPSIQEQETAFLKMVPYPQMDWKVCAYTGRSGTCLENRIHLSPDHCNSLVPQPSSQELKIIQKNQKIIMGNPYPLSPPLPSSIHIIPSLLFHLF